ncbi:alpha/beta fold hydrolase [Paraferrimonas sedimenticola]|uniref:Esterase n=1 Tax=Paraferrimonas sedimenticola TaxID=375674 RepID=A0AA37W1I0_9GAMM|nr:alpha/beta fold hydrolase [Paraferrimonas sedimenticola]GLP96252.1 esterase [Paraferrimonas sedimenticola]
MHYQRIGKGHPLILIHGLFGNSQNLRNLAQSLAGRYQVISVDVRNHGQSPWVDGMSYQELAQDLIKLMDWLDLPQVALVGHSMGGKIALSTAIQAPQRIRAVVAADIAPVAYEHHHDNIFDAMLSMDLQAIDNRQQAMDHLLKAGIDSGTSAFLLKNLARAEQGFQWRLNLAALRKHYHHIIGWQMGDAPYSGPALFIKGADSDYITAEHQGSILKQFPNAKAKIINGTGHWLHAEKPAAFNKLVGDFLDQLSHDWP